MVDNRLFLKSLEVTLFVCIRGVVSLRVNVIQNGTETEVDYIESVDVVSVLFSSKFVLSEESDLFGELVALIALLDVGLNDLLDVELKEVKALFELKKERAVK